MISFLLALQFLTVIPLRVRIVNSRKIADSLIYFPVVGLLIGLILSGLNNLLLISSFNELSTNIILVVVLAAITGNIHLDGLSDTFDALMSGKPRDEALKIMRDPHIGVMGVVSIACVLLLKIAFLSSMDPLIKPAVLIFMGILSRWSLVLAIFLFPYARAEGKAADFFAGKSFKIFLLSILTVFLFLFMQPATKIINFTVLVSIVIFTLVFGYSMKRKFGGLTGDILGALCELNELVVLLLIPFLTRIKCY